MPDIVINAANVSPRGGVPQFEALAGAAIAAGEMVYLDPADNRLKLADCDAVAPNLAARSPSGMALNSAGVGQPVKVGQPSGEVNVGAVLTPGLAYYLSPNPGKICPVADVLAGDSPVVIGIARSNSILRLGILESGVTL